MQKPVVHLNGSGREALIKKYVDVLNALNVAIKEMDENCPNARDYYPLGEDAYPKARNEWEAHIGALVQMRNYVNDLFDAVYD